MKSNPVRPVENLRTSSAKFEGEPTSKRDFQRPQTSSYSKPSTNMTSPTAAFDTTTTAEHAVQSR